MEIKPNENFNINKPREKIGFFRRMWYSITKFEKYPYMASEGFSKSIIYLLKIVLIFAFILCIGIVYDIYKLANEASEYISENISTISFSNGILNIDSGKHIIDKDISMFDKIIIDTQTVEQNTIQEYKSSIPVDSSGIILLKDTALIKIAGVSNIMTYSYSDILQSFNQTNSLSFDKQDIINYLTGTDIYIVYVIIFILMFLYMIMIYLITSMADVVVLAALGWITAVILKIRIKYSAMFSMSIYAFTLPILLNIIYIVVNWFTDFDIKYFQVAYTSIAYIYLITAIFMIKSDFIKREAELIKIQITEKENREEIEDKDNPNDEKEKKPKNKKEDEENKDKEKKPDEEPKGSEV